MRNLSIVGFAGLLLAVGPQALAQGNGKQLELSCSTEFEVYCGGWTVTKIPDSWTDENHIGRGERFVIGRRGQNHWLFPRSPLSGSSRWNEHKILLEKKVSRSSDCLVGEVRIKPGHEDESPDRPGQLHKLIIAPEVHLENPEIGFERRLKIGIVDTLVPNDPCRVPPESNERSTTGEPEGHRHAGTLHAED